jgi:hypothetical protein
VATLASSTDTGLFLEVTPSKFPYEATEALVQGDLFPDAQGRVIFPSLIPGATYRLRWATGLRKPRTQSTEFTVQAGQTKELPDISVPGPK